MVKNWISRSSAVETYGLTFDQIDYGIFTGKLQHREMGGGIIVLKNDLEKHLEELKKLPQKIWIFKSEAMKRYGLTKNQIETAMKKGFVRYKEVENPHYRQVTSIKLVIMDIESNLEKIKSFPKYSEMEKEKRKIYAERSKGRKELEFFCPRCKTTIRPLRGSQAFEEYWSSDKKDKEEILRRLIIAHYRHAHTDYDDERNNIDKWIAPQEVKRETGFDSFKEFLKFYKNIKDELDKDEREYYIDELNALRSIATENAKQHYNKIAQKLAEEDGLIKNEHL
jgi:hypothetical protein